MKVTLTFYKLIKAGVALGFGMAAGTMIFNVMLKIGTLAVLGMIS